MLDYISTDHSVVSSQQCYERQENLLLKLSGSLSTVSKSLACIPETELILTDM